MRLTPRDILIFEVLQRHRVLSSRYLYEITKAISRDPSRFRERLYQLTLAKYLERPEEINPKNVHDDFKSYILATKGEQALGLAGKRHEYPRPTAQGYEHQVMTGAITASIELGCLAAGLRFIDREEIVSRAPDSTKRSKRPIAIPAKPRRKNETSKKNWCEPDDVFGIEYGPKSRRYFALEADRGTESIFRTNLDDNSIERKHLCYKDILAKGTFETHFGVAKMYPMFITVSEIRAKNMMKNGDEVAPEYSSLFLYKWLPGFELYYKTPPLFPQLFTDPYERSSTPFFINKA
jgi:hypothetical protein